MGVFSQLLLLFWKSFKTALRSPIFTILEILLPLATCVMYWYCDEMDITGILQHMATPYSPSPSIRCESDNSTCERMKKEVADMCSQRECKRDFQWSDRAVIIIRGMDNNSLDLRIETTDSVLKRTASDDFSVTSHFGGKDAVMINDFVSEYSQYKGPHASINYTELSLKEPECSSKRLRGFLIFFFILVPLLAAINVTREIATEKESSIKDYLLVMGMGRVIYFIHHFLWALIKITPAIIGMAAILATDHILLALHFFIAFFLFVSSEIALGMIIPAFIKRTTIASLVTFVLLPTTVILPLIVNTHRSNIFLSLLSSLNPGHAMLHVMDTLEEGCYRDGQLSWFDELNYVLTFGVLLLMMIFDCVLFLSLSILIDSFGEIIDYVMSRIKRLVREKENEDEQLEINVHEDDTSLRTIPIDVELNDVYKTYPSGECAVRGVSMKLYRGQVTVLLGHNGAGKSTTFAMIAGITRPTEGNIRVGSESNSKKGQSIIGYCPQYNPIFPQLTVEEHLDFFAALKGQTNKEEVREEGGKMMELLELTHKVNERAANLSGGMKRKLCIAISLIGKSEVVLLDEPTAGVDAGARRDIERLLTNQRQQRTFLLTTHYTDEAENLGDRIMIMAGGKLVCSGSPHFLRKEFGAGYILSCVAHDSIELARVAQSTIEIAKELVGNVKLERQHGHQFEIWLDRDMSERFPELFRTLEYRKDQLGIESYGLSNNTLEQVFLRVGEMTGVSKEAKVKDALRVLLSENKKRAKGPVKILKSFLYLQTKRFFYELSEIRSIFFNFLPILIFIILFKDLINTIQDPISSFAGNDETIDLVHPPLCMRIGIRSDQDFIQRFRDGIDKQNCLVVEDVNESPSEWYSRTAYLYRPPVLAIIDRDTNGKIFNVSLAPNLKYGQLPLHLNLIRADSNQSWNVTAIELHRDKLKAMSEGKKDTSLQYPAVRLLLRSVAVLFFMIIQPILVYRSIGFYVYERAIKFRHQQYLTGLHKVIYWTASLISDFSVFLLNFIFAIICCSIFNFAKDLLTQLTPICFLIFLISIIKSYIFQRLFDSKSKAENLFLIFLFSTFLGFTIAWAVERATNKTNPISLSEDGFITNVLNFWIYMDPHLTVAFYFHESISVSELYYTLLVHLSIIAIIFILLESPLLTLAITMRKKTPAGKIEEVNSNLVLEVDNLVKSYGKNTAVAGISFGVEQHECFGLLGVNGAGKTSTFEVLTGSTLPSSGSARVAGIDCSAPAQIGYCPQFDALMKQLSGKQNLMILAALHGYRNPRLVADTVIECVGMKGHADKKSKSYSGGQRRKISVAAALLAQNSLIILDEPTAGIDPVTRRDIWSVICALRDSTNTAIVLTSHSMDEVEALCSRIAILRAGQIVAQGSSQTLKTQYGNNYKLTLIIDGKNETEVEEEVGREFRGAIRMKTASENTYNYEIPRDSSMLWSKMFKKAIEIAKRTNARDYCMSQASLEDAFIALNSQEEIKKEGKREGENVQLEQISTPF